MTGLIDLFAATPLLLAQPVESAWPASAGPAPTLGAHEYRDPPPTRADPPAGIYRHPDGTYRHADPPLGDYDPPPGYYPAAPADGRTPASAFGPLPQRIDAHDAWRARQTRLRIGVGVSGGLLGVGLLGVGLSLAFPNDCGGPITAEDGTTYPPFCEAWPIGAMVWGFVVVPASLIATIVYGVRLGRHNRARPTGLARIRLAPGGLQLRF